MSKRIIDMTKEERLEMSKSMTKAEMRKQLAKEMRMDFQQLQKEDLKVIEEIMNMNNLNNKKISRVISEVVIPAQVVESCYKCPNRKHNEGLGHCEDWDSCEVAKIKSFDWIKYEDDGFPKECPLPRAE